MDVSCLCGMRHFEYRRVSIRGAGHGWRRSVTNNWHLVTGKRQRLARNDVLQTKKNPDFSSKRPGSAVIQSRKCRLSSAVRHRQGPAFSLQCSPGPHTRKFACSHTASVHSLDKFFWRFHSALLLYCLLYAVPAFWPMKQTKQDQLCNSGYGRRTWYIIYGTISAWLKNCSVRR